MSIFHAALNFRDLLINILPQILEQCHLKQNIDHPYAHLQLLACFTDLDLGALYLLDLPRKWMMMISCLRYRYPVSAWADMPGVKG